MNIKKLEPAIEDLRVAIFQGYKYGRQKSIEKAFGRLERKVEELKRPWHKRLWARLRERKSVCVTPKSRKTVSVQDFPLS